MPLAECDDVFSPLDLMAFRFFREFSRSEYCLKAAGFWTGDPRKPSADWGAFSLKVVAIFEHPSTEVAEAVQYFLEFPPKKQVINDGCLSWDASPPTYRNPAEQFLLQVCRVRNNLFHGGKFNGHWFEPQRSEALLQHGLTILRACISGNEKTQDAYENRMG